MSMIHKSSDTNTNKKKPIDKSNSNSLLAPYPSPMHWIEDGVDHINISRAAKTELGKALDHSSKIYFNHSIFGKFKTIEAFWHYIQSEERDDRIRNLTGPALSNFAKSLTSIRVLNFRAMILDANYQRIVQNQVLYEGLLKSTLPLECYAVNTSGIRIRPTFFNWLIAGLEEIRRAIKENRDPDFTIFKDQRDKDIYHFVLPKRTKS